MLGLLLFQLLFAQLLWDIRCHSQQPLQEVLESIEERLDAMVDSLKVFESKFDARLDSIENKVDDHLKQVKWKLDSLHAKVERVDSKLDRADSRLNRTESSIQLVALKLDRVEGKLDHRLDIEGKIEALSYDLHGRMESSLEQVSRRLDGVEKWTDNAVSRRVEVSIQHVTRRMDVLESKLNADAIEAKVDDSIRDVTRRLDLLGGKLDQLLNISEATGLKLNQGDNMDFDVPFQQQVVKKLNSLEVQLNRSTCSDSLQQVLKSLEVQLLNTSTISPGDEFQSLMSSRLDSFDSKLDLGLNRSEVQGRKTAAAAQALWRVADELRGCSRMRGGGRPTAPGAQVARRLEELGAALETSFASLLVAQNAFIDTCRRDDHIPLLFEMLRSHAQQVGRQVRRHALRLERLLAPPPSTTAGGDKPDDYDFEESEPSSDYEEYQDGYGAENT